VVRRRANDGHEDGCGVRPHGGIYQAPVAFAIDRGWRHPARTGETMDGADDHLCAVDGALNIRGDAYVALDDLDCRVVEVNGASRGPG